MSIANYSQLKAAIENFSHRTDIKNLLDTFIDLAENKIDTRLRLRSNETTGDLTASTSSRFLALPASFLQFRRVMVKGNQNYELQYKAPEAMRVVTTGGRPRYFTVTNQIEFDRVPDQAYTIEVSYYTRLTPLSAASPTNNVLTDHPHLYLSGCLAELYRYARDEQTAQYYDQQFDINLINANKEDARGRHGPAPRMVTEGLTP